MPLIGSRTQPRVVRRPMSVGELHLQLQEGGILPVLHAPCIEHLNDAWTYTWSVRCVLSLSLSLPVVCSRICTNAHLNVRSNDNSSDNSSQNSNDRSNGCSNGRSIGARFALSLSLSSVPNGWRTTIKPSWNALSTPFLCNIPGPQPTDTDRLSCSSHLRLSQSVSVLHPVSCCHWFLARRTTGSLLLRASWHCRC